MEAKKLNIDALMMLIPYFSLRVSASIIYYLMGNVYPHLSDNPIVSVMAIILIFMSLKYSPLVIVNYGSLSSRVVEYTTGIGIPLCIFLRGLGKFEVTSTPEEATYSSALLLIGIIIIIVYLLYIYSNRVKLKNLFYE